MHINEILFGLEKAYHYSDVKQEMDSAQNIDEVLAILKNNNILDCTSEDLRKAVEYINNQELNDEQLNNVCGGQYAVNDLAYSICDWVGHSLGKLIKDLDLSDSSS